MFTVKFQFLVFTLLYFVAISSTRYTDADSNKKVFAHLMLEFTHFMDQTFFDNQIKRAKSVDIDGFALNVGYNGFEPDLVSIALAAAANNDNFTMFISFDMSGIPFNISVLSQFHFAANHSNYYKVNGRPFFSTYAGEYQDDFWKSWKASSGLDPYFCPCWTNYPTVNLLQNHPVADCIFTWNAWPARNSGPGAHFNTTGDQDLLASAKSTNKTYMAPLSPWFYTHVWSPTFNKHWIYGSETLLPERWQQIVTLQPDFVEIITWNDYTESTYVCSISKDVPFSVDGVNAMVNLPQPMHHDAWLNLSKHYIQWYKNNARPSVIHDQFYWWYRIYPKSNTSGDAPQFWNDDQDCVVIHSIVKSVTPKGGKYTMMIDLNRSTTSYNITQLEQTECIPFPMDLGYVTLSLIGPDDKVWWVEENNAPQHNNGTNFNAWTNSHSFPSP